MLKSNLSNKEIETAFGDHYPDLNHRKLLEQGVLKLLTGYDCKHELKLLMSGLELIHPHTHRPTRKGKDFVMFAMYDKKNSR